MKKKTSLGGRLKRLVTIIVIPLTVLMLLLMGIFVWYVIRYNSILNNVTSASEFSQDFKSDIDLKMYYYVIDSAYADGLPMEQVENARKLADELYENTTEKDSLEAIESVRELTENLEKRMSEIDYATNYDERVELLENNIYILTDLIQTYMYTYLYYESAHLSELQNAMEYQVTIIVFSLVAVVLGLMVIILAYANGVTKKIVTPISDLSDRVVDIGQGDLHPRQPVVAEEVEIQLLSDAFEEMVAKINDLVAENKKSERRKRHAELALLQAQINPHFLYNTLDTIIWLIESDKKQDSIDMVNSLSNFFRFSLSRGQDVITLAEEKKHVLSYLQIQKTRYADRMDYEIEIPEAISNCMLPKLTLQPLVENSIYHGIKMQREKGTIKVTAVERENTIELIVEDTGAGMTEERLEELRAALLEERKVGFGLRTVHQRIQLLFGDEYGLQLDSTEGEGTTIKAVLPKQYKEQGVTIIND